MTIYLDHSATTPVDERVLKAMMPFFGQKYGNPAETHFWGQEARQAIDQAREKTSRFLGAKPGEIIFTSGATESINLAHKGLVESIKYKVSSIKRPHIITSSIEHKAVLETCKHLEKTGRAEVTYLPVDQYGLIKTEEVQKAIQPTTVLVSAIYVNNEVGTIEPIREIGSRIRKINASRRARKQPRVYFHTDATQAIQYLNCDVNRLGVDLLSLTGHKFYAPKGVGALYVRKGTPLIRQQDGGGQEDGLRAGTENVPYIVGLGKAIELIKSQELKVKSQIQNLRDKLISGVLKIPGTSLTGHPTLRAPQIASLVIEGAEGEAMLLLLSDKGIAASSGSACTSGQLAPSHVLTAMGIPPELAHGSLRFSLGKETTKTEIDYVVKVLPAIVNRLRKMAPKLNKAS